MEKHQDDGTRTYDPDLASALDSNARELTSELFKRPKRVDVFTIGGGGKVRVTRPGYSEQTQIPLHQGRTVPNGSIAPLAGGKYRYPTQLRGPLFLEPNVEEAGK